MENTEVPEVQEYFRLRQEIMLHQKDMVTLLIDKGQRYTKGILCEEIVRNALREFLPSSFAVTQGFVDAKGQKQTMRRSYL